MSNAFSTTIDFGLVAKYVGFLNWTTFILSDSPFALVKCEIGIVSRVYDWTTCISDERGDF